MSDERFREYQRAVDSGDIDALPSLITEAVRTNNQIYKYAGKILYNLNDHVVRALEQGGLVDVQYYGGDHFRDIAPRVARADKAIASLEVILINNLVTHVPRSDRYHLVNASCFWSEVFNSTFIIRGLPLLQITNGERLGTADITPYFSRANEDAQKHPQDRTILVYNNKTNDTPSHFFGQERDTIILDALHKDGRIYPLTMTVGRRTQPFSLTASPRQNYTAIALTTKHAEHILGNPNVFDFEAIK